MKHLLLITLIIPSLSIANDKKPFTLSDFNSEINKAASQEKYRSKLLKSDDLQSLIKEKPITSKHSNLLKDEPINNGGEVTNPVPQGEVNNNQNQPITSVTEPVKKTNSNTNSNTSNGKKQTKTNQVQTEPKKVTITSKKTPQTNNKNNSVEPVISEIEQEKIEQENTVFTKSAKTKVTKKASKNKKPVKAKKVKKEETFKVTEMRNIAPVTFSFNTKRVVFGITIGQTIPVRLKRASNNVQTGYIELVTLEDVAGRKKTLPKNSIIFTRPYVTKGSSRLYLSSVRGITPNGKEFTIKSQVYDHYDVSGLSGVIESDGRAIERSLASGSLALGNSLVQNLSSNPLANAAATTANSLLKEGNQTKKAHLDKAAFIVSASPQLGTLTVEETF